MTQRFNRNVTELLTQCYVHVINGFLILKILTCELKKQLNEFYIYKLNTLYFNYLQNNYT